MLEELNIYNILKEILQEEVTPYDVTTAINNRQKVIISYDDEQFRRVGSRIVEPYVFGTNKAGNSVVRIFQGSGDTYRGIPHWKTIRLDRIKSWKPTNSVFMRPPQERGWKVEPYNNNGDRSMTTIFAQVHFDDNDLKDTSSLGIARNRTKEIQSSTPININDFNAQSGYGPVSNKETNKSSEENLSDFQKMLNRNLEITRQEKAKRGKDMGGNKIEPTQPKTANNITRGPITEPTNTNWNDYDKAQAEKNYQDKPNLYRKNGELRTNKRELERQKRRDNFSIADEKPLHRRGNNFDMSSYNDNNV